MSQTIPPHEAILARAAERAAEARLPYAGAVAPEEAWALAQAGAAVIVDVRSEPEYKFVGHVPDTPLLPWRGRDEASTQDFLARLNAFATPETKLLFLCRSAVRSHHAAVAAAAAGYPHAYNILEGFEGQKDASEQRGHLDGWKKRGLPWVQD